MPIPHVVNKSNFCTASSILHYKRGSNCVLLRHCRAYIGGAEVKRWKDWRMSCDVDEVMERLENELSSFSTHSFASPTSQALNLIHPASRPWFFLAPSSQCNLLFIFCFFQEKQLSLTETIKYEINKVDAGLLLSRLQF